jgi:DNA-binding XRE family transcriptional regulator
LFWDLRSDIAYKCSLWDTKIEFLRWFVALEIQILDHDLSLRGYNKDEMMKIEALGLQMTNLADVSDMLRAIRRETRLSQEELARRAGVARTTVARMETLAKNDMSVSVLVRLLEAAGYDLKVVAHGHARTLEDILAEQRMPDQNS